jgi:hypothetical protein
MEFARRAALAALEAVEGRDTSVQAILARHGERRLSPEEVRQPLQVAAHDEG